MALFNYECDEVKSIIEEVSPNYPQLTTYEKEWLYFHKYGYIPGVPVELEYETVSVNPTGSVSNAIPHKYKSAILTGNTLVNHVDKFEKIMTTGTNNYRVIHNNTLSKPLKPNTNYLFINHSNVGYTLNVSIAGETTSEKSVIVGLKTSMGKFTTPNNTEDFTRLMVYLMAANQSELKYNTFMIIEYQEGMENWNIPYFEGMQSVQMPVLTTSNEDGTKTNILTVNEEVELRGTDDVKDELDLTTGKLTQRTIQLPLNSDYFNFSRVNNSDQTNTIRWQLMFKDDFIANSIKVKSNGKCNIINYYKNGGQDKECIFIHPSALPNRLQIKQLRTDTRFTTSEELELFLLENQAYIVLELATESIKTVDLTPLNNPYEGTNHYELTSNIPCEAILEVPVVSTGKQTLEEINN